MKNRTSPSSQWPSIISMVVEMVPLSSVVGRWHSPSPNWQEKYHLYTTYIYILPSGGLYATYHLLGEPFQQPLIIITLLNLKDYEIKV